MNLFEAKKLVETYFDQCNKKGLIADKATIATNGEECTVVYPGFAEDSVYLFEVENQNGETFSRLVQA